ncbi:hypothetical protein, conserved in T. vivax [Trypanosoma vivax Y486]|uniref:Uncharacterized protein n=1 Tax=Trypanosoma vivax (strain Y486) TaxID=1055687 RepID=F9WT67_TRYVY|nr:hypothetical protein, conserved in T. vivax [Trypanosoma vivax Y486]|eukprot:CCD20759.1 hypothetical protein, conserved in T. vivax [Trypanosoma vivax Y486]
MERKFHSRHRTHPRVTAHTTQLSAQGHLAHACVRLPRKRAHAVTAAAPQAAEQASNSAATSAAASTVTSSAVALRSATAECAAARHAVSSLTSRAARGAPSAQRHGAAPPLSLHRIGSAPTRARLLPQHTQAAWPCATSVICASSHRPRPRRWTGSAMATAGRGPSATASSARVPAGASRVRAARPPNANRHATASGSGAPKHSPQLCRNSKPRVRRSNGKPAHSSRRAAQHPQSKNFSQRRAALSGILYSGAVAHASPHGVSVSCAHCWLNGASNAASCLLQTRHLTVNRHGELFCRHG